VGDPNEPAGAQQLARQLAQRCAEVMLASDHASREAGLRLTEVGPGTASMAMTVTAAMSNGHGTCHGGYVFLLADTAFAVACNSFGEVSVAQACDIVFVVPARTGDELLARAALRTGFGRNGIYDVTVTRGGGEVVAEFRGRSRSLGTRLLDP
jgi:acyl-CoA thioesterase